MRAISKDELQLQKLILDLEIMQKQMMEPSKITGTSINEVIYDDLNLGNIIRTHKEETRPKKEKGGLTLPKWFG